MHYTEGLIGHRTHRPTAFALVVASFAIVATVRAAPAEAPAGLILEVSGTVSPSVRPYTEIPSGTALSLSRGAHLVFVHYQTCKTVTVTGGTVTISAASYATRDGQQTDMPTPCPKKVNVRGGGELGGVVYRSVSANRGITLPVEAAFVLSGPRASSFASARVSRDRALVAEGAIRDQVFRWPAGTAPLPPDTTFELTLVPIRAEDRPVTIRFATPAVAAPPGQAPLVVIGVD
jgi:hypothetical protein